MAVNFPLAVVLKGIDKLTPVVSKVEKRFGRFGASAKKAGKALTLGLTAPTLLFGAASVQAGGDFDFQMRRVQALSGATGTALAQLTGQAKDLGRVTQFSAKEAGEGQEALAQAGFNVNEILGATPAVLELASAAKKELGETAAITAKALRGYGIPAARAFEVTDKLAFASIKANQDLTDLGEALKFAGPVASAFGQDFDRTLALLAKFADVGFQGGLGGTALARAFSELAKAPKKPEAVATLAELGVNVADLFDERGKLVDLTGLLAQLGEAGIKPAQALTIFGERSFKPLLKIFDQTDAVEKFAGQLRDSVGFGAEVAAIQMGGAFGATKRLQAAFEGLLISIGESGLLDRFTALAEKAAAWLTNLSETNPKTLDFAVKLGLVTAAVGPLILVVGNLALAVSGLAKGIGVAITVSKGLGTVLATKLVPAIWATTAAMLANPIGAIIAGVAALIAVVAALVTDFGGFRTALVDTFVGIWEGMKLVGMGIRNFFVGIFTAIRNTISGIVEWIRTHIRKLVDWLPDFVLNKLGIGPMKVQVGDERASSATALARSTIGEDRLARAVGRRPVADTLDIGGRRENFVRVQFDNLPRGARIVETRGNGELELDMGFAGDGGF